MSTEYDMLVIEVPGLCVGSAEWEEMSRLVILYSARMCMTKRHLKSTRRMHSCHLSTLPVKNECADFDVSSGTSISDELTAVAWCDGDLEQVNAIINDRDSCTDMKVIANKQNAARAGVEQPADLAKVFVIFKQTNKTRTVTDAVLFRQLMKRRVTKAFESDGLKVLNLISNKKNFLIEFIASCD